MRSGQSQQPHSESLGSRLKRERKARGLSAFRLAVLCDPLINPASIYSYEACRVSPRATDLRTLAAALGLSVAELVEGTDAA